MNRRHFIEHCVASLGYTSFIPGIVFAADSTPRLTSSNTLVDTIAQSAVKHFTQADWRTIATVQDHLLPSEAEAPGAMEVNALHYLHNYLTTPATDPENVKFILSGTRLLQKLATQEQGKLRFSEQSSEQKEALLRQFEQDAIGRRWLISLLNYVLEALLADPVYGGNPQGIGWQWLEHRSGEPHPPMNKRYWLL